MRLTLSGNEALARGAYEAGVKVVTGYPGSPATRFLEHILEISGEEVHAEWAANEKVAMEMALGASMSGRRAAVCFKCVGLNVAMDPLMVANLAGVVGGLVIILGDDPGAYGSQNEQDGRLLARAAEVPLLEFADPQEAYLMARGAFRLSEEFRLPVIIRATRAASVEKAEVEVKEERRERGPIPFHETTDWKNLPLRNLAKHHLLHSKRPAIAGEFNGSVFNAISIRGEQGIIGAGYAAAKVRRFLEATRLDISLLKIGTIYPPPEKQILGFLKGMSEVLVAEEVQPLVEGCVRSIAQRNAVSTKVYGRDTGHIRPYGDLTGEILAEATRKAFKIEIPDGQWPDAPLEEFNIRGMNLPPECPYYQAFQAFKEVMPADEKERPIFIGDDGCLMRLMNEPFGMMDAKFCMGSAIGIAHGMALGGEKRKVVAMIGDSALFHTGFPPLFNAIANDANIVVIVLDNASTAMTGCQPHPGSSFDSRKREREGVDLEDLIRGSGVKLFRTVDAFGDKALLAEGFKECLQSTGISVLLVRGPCPYIRR